MILRVNLKNSNSSETKIEKKIDDFDKEESSIPVDMEIQNPSLWSPESPNVYSLDIALYKGSTIIDAYHNNLSFSQFTVAPKDITLNNKAITLKGTTYFLNELGLQKVTVYEKIRRDLQLIKNTGFNAVRFAKVYPHPYELEVCREIGLIPLIEIPLNSIPEEILSDSEFKMRASNRLKEFADTYSNYSDEFILGLGSCYLANSPATQQFISDIAASISNKNILTFASFAGVQSNSINGVDLYGIELFTRNSDATRIFLEGISNDPKYFLSEVNYPNYLGSKSGYLVQNSYEAQAKYFENTIEISDQKKLGGFFLSTLFNYTGNYKSAIPQPTRFHSDI